MISEDNEAGSETLVLCAGDNPLEVAEPHSELLTPEILRRFSAPDTILRDALENAHLPAPKKWLLRLLDAGDWRLELADAFPPMTSVASFWWDAPRTYGAAIFPTKKKNADSPSTLGSLYGMADAVDWMGAFCSGGIFTSSEGTLRDYPETYWKNDLDPDETYVWGEGPSGDLLYWTHDDTAGWIHHDSSKIQKIGSHEDAFDWVFNELLEERCPDVG